MHKQLRHKLSFLKQIIDNFHEPCKILTSHRQVYFHPKQLVDCNTHKLVLDSLQILFSMTGMLFLEVYGHHHHHLLENTMGVMKLKGIGQAFFLNLKKLQYTVHCAFLEKSKLLMCTIVDRQMERNKFRSVRLLLQNKQPAR